MSLAAKKSIRSLTVLLAANWVRSEAERCTPTGPCAARTGPSWRFCLKPR